MIRNIYISLDPKFEGCLGLLDGALRRFLRGDLGIRYYRAPNAPYFFVPVEGKWFGKNGGING